jgi:hypothetical protein
MVVALHSPEPSREIVNVRLPNGLVEEVHANVSCKSIDVVSAPTIPSANAQRWIDVYRAHEEGMLRCIEAPSHASIAAALLADPISPQGVAMPITDAIWRSYQNGMEAGSMA